MHITLLFHALPNMGKSEKQVLKRSKRIGVERWTVLPVLFLTGSCRSSTEEDMQKKKKKSYRHTYTFPSSQEIVYPNKELPEYMLMVGWNFHTVQQWQLFCLPKPFWYMKFLSYLGFSSCHRLSYPEVLSELEMTSAEGVRSFILIILI